MKKRVYTWIIILILVVAICIFVYSFLIGFNKEKEISSQEILEIIKPEIDIYCNLLKNNSTNSWCPTCVYYYPDDKDRSYLLTNNLSEGDYDVHYHRYTIEKIEENYNVNMRLHLIYGMNTRPGIVTLSFEIDKDGNIINKNLPVMNCL